MKDIPREYTLGAGHCKFFRNKLLYLAKRHSLLLEECGKRRLSVSKDIRVDLSTLPEHIQMFCCNDWTPTQRDHAILIGRLKERFTLRSKAYHITRNNHKVRIDSELEFEVYYYNHLQKYL